jgi:hypothetical protein
VQRPFCSISFAFDFVCAALKWTDPLGFGLDEFEKLRGWLIGLFDGAAWRRMSQLGVPTDPRF